jgi:hypothetical protein
LRIATRGADPRRELPDRARVVLARTLLLRAAMRYALVAMMVLGCADAGDGEPESTAPAPLVGVDGSHDQADRNCNIVLRGLERTGTSATSDSYVWTGSLEVSSAAAAEGLAPAVIYQWGSDPSWHQGTVTAATDGSATPGFAKYTVTLDHDLLGPGMSGTAQTSADIQVVPYLPMPGGGRLFDHNRNPSDFANYHVVYPDFAVWGAPAVCAAPTATQAARLVFVADHTQHREGVLTAGGTVAIQYDTQRLTTCRDSQGGHPLWDITAHVRFEPSGEEVGASVRDGAPTFTVPTDGARQVVVWFENTDAYGCQAWDSNFGANYAFDVAVAPQWIGLAQNDIVRDADDPCDGGAAASGGFAFDTWARQRAAVANLCFQVYQPGLTDRDDPTLWQELDAQLHWRVVGPGGATAWQAQPIDLDRRVGNNARYKASWRALDPFRAYHCPDAAPGTSADGMYAQLGVEYYATVNGGELRPAPGAAFGGTFTDYPSDPWRAANCH